MLIYAIYAEENEWRECQKEGMMLKSVIKGIMHTHTHTFKIHHHDNNDDDMSSQKVEQKSKSNLK